MTGRRVRIDPNKEKIVDEVVNSSAPPPPLMGRRDRDSKPLDEILRRQMLGLEQLTEQLVAQIEKHEITKDTPNQLATCIKITMELKAKENDMLGEMSDEDLELLAGEDDVS